VVAGVRGGAVDPDLPRRHRGAQPLMESLLIVGALVVVMVGMAIAYQGWRK
jgi:hypothetical protein